MALAKSFRDLDVYQAAQEAAATLFELSKRFPRTEQYSLTDQIRGGSRAVNAMIAEAWARRRYRPAFVDKINQALGEAMETQAWLDHARHCEYLNETEFSQNDQCWQKIGANARAHDRVRRRVLQITIRHQLSTIYSW